MNNNEQKRNEIIEQMLSSKWADIYANKLKNKFRNVMDAKGIIVSNMFLAIEVYDRNHDLMNDEYVKIEKYVFQKAWQISNDAELERLGKKRMGKKKELKQIKVEYNDVMGGEYQDVVKADSYKDVLSEKDLAIRMIQFKASVLLKKFKKWKKHVKPYLIELGDEDIIFSVIMWEYYGNLNQIFFNTLEVFMGKNHSFITKNYIRLVELCSGELGEIYIFDIPEIELLKMKHNDYDKFNGRPITSLGDVNRVVNTLKEVGIIRKS